MIIKALFFFKEGVIGLDIAAAGFFFALFICDLNLWGKRPFNPADWAQARDWLAYGADEK
jgi:hypothetical protein